MTKWRPNNIVDSDLHTLWVWTVVSSVVSRYLSWYHDLNSTHAPATAGGGVRPGARLLSACKWVRWTPQAGDWEKVSLDNYCNHNQVGFMVNTCPLSSSELLLVSAIVILIPASSVKTPAAAETESSSDHLHPSLSIHLQMCRGCCTWLHSAPGCQVSASHSANKLAKFPAFCKPSDGLRVYYWIG